MEKIEREELKKEYPHWIERIQKMHEMGPEIEQELFVNNKPVKNLGHSREYFTILELKSKDKDDMMPIYISYHMDHIIVDVKRRLLARRLLSITLFESFVEFEAERVRAMSKSKDQTGLNFN
jgi:hypothetical protein